MSERNANSTTPHNHTTSTIVGKFEETGPGCGPRTGGGSATIGSGVVIVGVTCAGGSSAAG